jgi:ribosome-binding factor A
MTRGTRPERVADQIRAEISGILAREVKDPGIGFLTVTHVKVTPDLQLARVYYTVLGDMAARGRAAQGLTRVGPFVRRQLGGRLRLRHVPELQFFYDESVEREDRIERLFQEIREAESRQKDGDGAGDDDGNG